MPMGQSVDPLDASIEQLNQRLKVARLGIKVERRGHTLSLRGTFPPRPGSPKQKPHQQRIPLGMPANKAGLKRIEQEAKVVAAQLIEKSFDWTRYLPPDERQEEQSALSLEDRIDQFRRHMMGRHSPDDASLAALKSTWAKAYAPYLKKLMAHAGQIPLQDVGTAIVETIEALPSHSRSRQVGCTALKAFADFHGIALSKPMEDLWGSYGHRQIQRRHLPSDEEILIGYERIPNPAWRFVYGIMATYGLRNHEVFFCDYSSLQSGDPEAMITVLETTKTGLHDVWPFFPEWVDRFNLRTILLPAINTDLQTTTLQRVGQQVTTQFNRYQLPFSPYDLRHAWAVRTIHFGLPDTVAARMMGHSVAIHTRTYHRWITLRDQRRAVQSALQKGDWSAPLDFPKAPDQSH
jgi:integrase